MLGLGGAGTQAQLKAPALRRTRAFQLVKSGTYRGAGNRRRPCCSTIFIKPRRTHEIVLSWFEAEEGSPRTAFLRETWTCGNSGNNIKTKTTEVRMLLRSLYEKGPCSFCRESVL